MGSLRVIVGTRQVAPIYFLFGVMTTISEVPPSLANVLSAFAFVRPVRRLDCLDPGGVIKWRASERVSLVRQRSWNFATRDSRAPQLACWTAGRYEDGGLVPPDHLTSSFKGIQTDGQIIVARHCTAVMEWMDH